VTQRLNLRREAGHGLRENRLSHPLRLLGVIHAEEGGPRRFSTLAGPGACGLGEEEAVQTVGSADWARDCTVRERR